MTFRIKSLFAILLLLVVQTACGVYSFTGAALSPDIKTLSVGYFYNDSNGGPPNLAQLFTDKFKDYFQQNTSLTLVQNDGDLQFEGSIVSYNLKPIATTASGNANQGDLAGGQRLTITVKVSYVNTKDESFNFDRSFSFYDDFDPAKQSFSAVENDLINNIFDQIILDIFNASVANW